MVADEQELVVVEVTTDRYAIRRPGEFTGPNWSDPDYIVATNHNLCTYSWDAMNERTTIPMTIFGDGFTRDSKTGQITGLDDSGTRFWTLMWDLKRQHGEIDAQVAQKIMSGLYCCDETTGKKTTVDDKRADNSRIWGKSSNQGTVSLAAGTADGKVTILHGGRTEVHWTMGSPAHWEGAWDAYHFGE